MTDSDRPVLALDDMCPTCAHWYEDCMCSPMPSSADVDAMLAADPEYTVWLDEQDLETLAQMMRELR